MLNHRYWKIGASSNGKKDGKLNIPTNITVNPPYIKEFCNLGEGIIKNIAAKWAKFDKKLKTKWLNAETAKMKSREREKLAQKNEDEAVKRFKQLNDNEIPSMYRGASSLIYWIVIFIMFLSEFPINNAVFRLFGEAEVLNYLVAGGIGLVILFAGHLLGLFLHEYHINKIRRASCYIIPIVVIAVIFLIGYLRALYLHKIEGMVVDNTIMIAFGVFNLMFFVIAALYSYKIHNPHLMQVHKTAARNRKAKADLERAEKILDKAKTHREKKFSTMQNKANVIRDIVHQRINIYWTSNLRNREDSKEGNIPEPAAIMLPLELSRLEWENENLQDQNNLDNRKNGRDKYENNVGVIQHNDN